MMLIYLHISNIVSTFAVSFDDRGAISDDRLVFTNNYNSKYYDSKQHSLSYITPIIFYKSQQSTKI